VPAFLSSEEVEFYRQEYERHPGHGANRNYDLVPLEGAAHEAMTARVTEVLAVVAAATDLRPDLPIGGQYFATRRGIQFGWHQDHESYFTIQNHYDYLNFYLPIVKPRRDRSNLCVIPFDALREADPRIYERVMRAGATSYLRLQGRTLIFHDDTGRLSVMSGDVERLVHTPQLEEGELLLLRGDMIHRTEDALTERVALSFRAARSGAVVSRARLADGGLTKAWMMMNDASAYERMFRVFDLEGRATLTYGEIRKALEGQPEPGPVGRKRLLRLLLRQKWREGVLLRFFAKSLGSVVGSLAANLIWGPPRTFPASAPAHPPAGAR
jgi:hypothetical protein